jgi:hypothetical protein
MKGVLLKVKGALSFGTWTLFPKREEQLLIIIKKTLCNADIKSECV